MSAAIQREWTPEIETFEPVASVDITVDVRAASRRDRQLAILETILEDYRPALQELANR